MRRSDANPLSHPWIKLLACAAALILAFVLGAPRAQAITLCDVPCFQALETCTENCLATKGGQACSNICSTEYNICISHVTIPCPGEPVPPDKP
jgi:hypothetical protein